MPCKTYILELLVRCVMFACGLLIGAVFDFRAAMRGIVVQERFHQWLVKTGQANVADED